MERWRENVSEEEWNWYLNLEPKFKEFFEKTTDNNMKFLDRVCAVNQLTEEQYNQLPYSKKLALCARELSRTMH